MTKQVALRVLAVCLKQTRSKHEPRTRTRTRYRGLPVVSLVEVVVPVPVVPLGRAIGETG